MPRVLVAGALAAIGGCLVSPPPVGHDVATGLLAAMVLGVVPLLAMFAYHARRHQRLAGGMARLASPGTLAGEPVEVVPGLGAPLVAGLWTPRIFSGDDLDARLDEEELRAVILHERHHQCERAPLRLVALSAVAPLLGRVVTGRAWLEWQRARLEIAADRHALAAGVSRAALASALLKLSVGPGAGWAPGFATAAELRVEALLSEPSGRTIEGRSRWTNAAIAVVAACLVVVIS